jgi:hypothetical protein
MAMQIVILSSKLDRMLLTCPVDLQNELRLAIRIEDFRIVVPEKPLELFGIISF